jgi:hypothetical protein
MSYWYYRESKDDELVGPMSYRDAVAGARYLSKHPDHSGIAEIVVFVGQRPGDPPTFQQTRVVYMYIRGKRTLAGRAAQYHSIHNLPPRG